MTSELFKIRRAPGSEIKVATEAIFMGTAHDFINNIVNAKQEDFVSL